MFLNMLNNNIYFSMFIQTIKINIKIEDPLKHLPIFINQNNWKLFISYIKDLKVTYQKYNKNYLLLTTMTRNSEVISLKEILKTYSSLDYIESYLSKSNKKMGKVCYGKNLFEIVKHFIKRQTNLIIVLKQ